MNTSSESAPSSPGPNAAEVTGLIREFLASGRSEKAFSAIVEALGGFVYASALRRSGDPQLAEEISQNVFALLARKCTSLAKHPAPLAWIFQTTKYEAAKVMRSEKRHQRRRAAYAQEQAGRNHEIAPPSNAEWRDALPHLDASLDELAPKDREVILERFVYDRKIREIAANTGQSEAACKMRLRRALDRLSGMLQSRGVTLSVTGLSALLTAELAKAAPSALVSASGSMLASGGALSTTAVITNTIQTMSAAKSATVAAATVLVLATGPVVWQYSQASSLRSEITNLEEQRDGLLENPEKIEAGKGWPGGPRPSSRNRTVGDLLAEGKVIDPATFVAELMEAMTGQNMVAMLRLFMPLAKLSDEEIDQFILAIQAQKMPSSLKENALRMLADFSSKKGHGEQLDRSLAIGAEPHSLANKLAVWAAEEPDAALAWYLKNEAEGRLAGKSVHEAPRGILYGSLLGGMVQKDPEKALELFGKEEPELQREMSRIFADALVREKGNGTYADRLGPFLEKAADSEVRSEMLIAASQAVQRKDGSAAGVGLLDAFSSEMTSVARGRALAGIAVNRQLEGEHGVADQAKWLLDQTTEENVSAAINLFVSRHSWRGSTGVEEWIEAQPAGVMRDRAWHARANAYRNQGDQEAGLRTALRIGDPAVQKKVINDIAVFMQRTKVKNAAEIFQKAGLDPAEFELK